MVKCLSEFEYFYCVLKNKIIIFKIRRSKVTDYAALMVVVVVISKTYVGIISNTTVAHCRQTNGTNKQRHRTQTVKKTPGRQLRCNN